MTYQAIQNEIDMLRGNINRMYVTDESNELAQQKDWGVRCIATLFSYIDTEKAYETWAMHQINKALYTEENQPITSKEDAVRRINQIFDQNKNKFEK